ncbi:GNAT family N-acetyltransferase [Nocardia sp. NEAU-G5]|uniref:GNAT family N-acetyltransferase n=1 Tax=Nocardia albiluteola TaxID=2842303 RepID=A0ABS6B0B0_9NOCA|nr:GNAT family N-acetyltransferase [Nocardia albiluteola]MBU3062906.1 GNAT family N-acetyltransferase [Nocardia albiluteola]
MALQITPLNIELAQDVLPLMQLGEPFVRARTASDYWLYAHLFASTCPVAHVDGELAGAIIAFRSQEIPDDIYVQDVITHPDFRRRGVTTALIGHIVERAHELGCRRIYLTSEPENAAAHAAWTSLGFKNVAGDRVVNGVSVIADYKGPGKDRAVYELTM